MDPTQSPPGGAHPRAVAPVRPGPAQTRPERNRIGFYVHHHGAGHLRRVAAIVSHLEAPATVLTSLDLDEELFGDHVEIVPLPPDWDHDMAMIDPTAGGALHWAPLSPALLARRAAVMVGWLTRDEVAALVCDVSIEAALLARLCGISPIVVRQHGARTDPAHELAFRVACGVLAPFPEALEASCTTAELRRRCFYSGFISNIAPLPCRSGARATLGLDERPCLLIALGGGEHTFTADRLDALGRELPDWQVLVVGSLPPGTVTDPVRIEGWVPDIRVHLAAADVVAATAGSNLVAEVAMAGRPLIAVPQDRPFREQHVRTQRLAELDAAVVLADWPGRNQWRAAIHAARRVGIDGLARLAGGPGAAGTARWIVETAARAPAGAA